MPAIQILTEHSAGKPAREPCSKPVDLVHLARFTLGDRELEREVLELFTAQVSDYMGWLRDACGTKDWHEAAHTIKGSAGAVGAWRVAKMAQVAETLKDDPSPERRAEAVSALQDAIDEAGCYIKSLFEPA